MPECAACGNHLPTDQLCSVGDTDAVPIDDAIDECPHRYAGRASQSRRATPVGPATPDAGDGASNSAEPPEKGGDAPTGEESPELEFTVTTAGRSLEWPRQVSDVDRSPSDRPFRRSVPTGQTDGSRHSRDRFRSALTSVLDAFR